LTVTSHRGGFLWSGVIREGLVGRVFGCQISLERVPSGWVPLGRVRLGQAHEIIFEKNSNLIANRVRLIYSYENENFLNLSFGCI